MRYLFTSLKFCSGNFKLSVDRFLGRISSFNLCTKSLMGLHHNTMTATSSKISFILKRNSHVVTSENSDDTTEEDNPDFSSVTNNDPVLERRLKELFLEVEELRLIGMTVPQKVNLHQWKELILTTDKSRRRMYLKQLFVKEKRYSSIRKKEENAFLENLHIKHAVGLHTIFLDVFTRNLKHFHHSRLMQAMQFSQKLVVDFSYDCYMESFEAENCRCQVSDLISENCKHDNPFDLYFCNVRRESITFKQLVNTFPGIGNPEYPINIMENCYLDLFPKEKLVYLTPHCKEEMREFDHDAVYIIGALVDTTNNGYMTFSKAKREGLRMAKLPLDQYLRWGIGSKPLGLIYMIRILLEIRRSGSWDDALQHVPRRTIVSTEDLQEKSLKQI